MWFETEYLRISHVIVGIEGGRNQDPQPAVPQPLQQLAGRFIATIGDFLTWAGDLGGIVQEYLYQHHFPELFGRAPDYPTFQEYKAKLATREQLVADIDGINIASRYDRTRPLADNLRAYYGRDSRRRFSVYLQTQRTADGQQALALESNRATPTLTVGSRQFLAETIGFTAEILLAVVMMEVAQTTGQIVPYPDTVVAALQPTSQEVQEVVQAYAQFLQAGLTME